jgi:deazaflavin-dependent oxidoreductase (nitroreductase family)
MFAFIEPQYLQLCEKEGSLMHIVRMFFRLLLIILFLAATFFLISIALGKAMQQKGMRDSIRRFNQRRVNPITLRSAGKRSSDYAIVTHVGRRSGHPYTTPVRAIPFGEGFVIPLPYGASTDWCRNVLAAGKCTLRWHEQEYLLEKPEVVPLANALHIFQFSLRITSVTNGVKQCLVLHPHREVPE